MRLVYSKNPQPWKTRRSTQTLSFALMNQYSWDPIDKEISLFSFHGPGSGFIAKPSVMENPGLIKCSFPCDGYSDHRTIGVRGCGCGPEITCPQGTTDWCDEYGFHLKDFRFRGKGKPCAFKPHETSKMLKTYHYVKEGKAFDSLQQACHAWGQAADGHNAWNEIVVDNAIWRKGGAENIAAFVVPSKCYDNWTCKTKFWMWYTRFKMAGEGKRPVLVMDQSKRTNPYYLM